MGAQAIGSIDSAGKPSTVIVSPLTAENATERMKALALLSSDLLDKPLAN